MAKYTPTEEEKKRWGITGKRKGGPGRRVHDWDLHRDIVNMPRRDSLPQEGPEQFTAPVVPGSEISFGAPMVDNRSDERKAWDKRMEALRERLEQNRKTEKDQAETYRKRWVQSRVAGRPMDEAGNPVEEPKPAEEPKKESPETATAAQTQGNKLSNGQPKVGQPAAAQPPTRPGALKPKKEPVGPGATRRYGLRAGTGDISWDGTPVPKNFSAARSNLEGILTAETGAARDRAEAAAQVQHAVSSHAPFEAYQASMNERERIEQIGKDRRARQAAEREAAAQRRADKRFADRTLYNEADWKNLGREGSNKADYSDRRTGESDKDWGVREQAIKERQGRMDALRKRMDAMGLQDAEKNSFYANDPNKQQNLARLRGLVDKAGNGITDAQMEGVNATLDAWEKGAAEKGARNEAFRKMKDATEISRLRGLYSMGDTSVWSPEDVRERHRSATAAARREIMKGMQIAPGTAAQDTTGQAGGAAMAKYAQDWQKLLDNGFDPMAEFREMMGSTTKNEAGRTWKDLFKDASASISTNDPDFADKQDQLKRRFILSWAMNKENLAAKEAGHDAPFKETGGESGAAGADLAGVDNFTKALPGKAPLVSREMAEKTNPLQPKQSQSQAQLQSQPQQPQQTPGAQIFTNAADAMKARDAANAAAGVIKPRSQTRLRPGDKREETMAW